MDFTLRCTDDVPDFIEGPHMSILVFSPEKDPLVALGL